MERTILVLGATGGVGGETARAMARRGWHVRALSRQEITSRDGFEWIRGDAFDRETVIRAATGVDAIMHAVNPAGYLNWGTTLMPLLENSLAAAQAAGARLVLPGNIYNYDPRLDPFVTPESRQSPTTRKGAIRRRMEHRIEQSRVRALIVRAGDFFGPQAGGSWFSQGMVKPGKPVRSIMVPGKRGIGHAWAYLPDLGETFARLIDRDADLPDFARHHFAGVWDADNRQIAEAVVRVVKDPTIRIWRMPWGLLPLMAPFNPMMREMIEMRPFWEKPLRLDNTTLVDAIGPEPHTPLDQAVRTTLSALGCLEAAAQTDARLAVA